MNAILAAASSERDRLILQIGLLAGLRVSEIVSLRVEHVDLDSGILEVHAGKGDKDRNLPLHPRLVEPLRAWIGERQTGYLFPSRRSGQPHLGVRQVQRMVKCVARDAEIARVITPHKLRHTFATTLLAKGADLLEIKDLLGHASVATTQIYAHALPERLRGAVERL